MAKVNYIALNPEIENEYYGVLRPCDRFSFSRVGRKKLLFSREQKLKIAGRSLLGVCSTMWRSFSDSEKLAWSEASQVIGLNGWQAFVQDYCARLKNDYEGVAVPSILHQSRVGQLHIESPANELKITQLHPALYYIYQKVVGTQSQYDPVPIYENITLPFKLSINYKSNLTVSGPDPFAKFYARFYYSYQGVNREHLVEIPLDFFSDWKNEEVELTELVSIVLRYDLFFHLHDLQGDVFFDNMKAEHSGQNWVRDPHCKDINRGFSRNYYQIPRHWAGVVAPNGTFFESVYKDFN